MNNILKVNNLSVEFKVKTEEKLLTNKFSSLKAVENVSFLLKKGEILGIVGESGCGKSSLARAIIGLNKIANGSIMIDNQEITDWQQVRKIIQMIFQDPLASLNPRMTIADIIAEPLRNFYTSLTQQEILQKTYEIMELCGLSRSLINRYAHEFSGGQCQRIGIARALILKPQILICDEPVSALDVSIQAQIINLLKEFQTTFALSLLFIAHDLSIVRHISDRVLVMYLGKIVEIGDKEEIYDNAKHPYTKALIASSPNFSKTKKQIKLLGELPSPINKPSGCVFHTRCHKATTKCVIDTPLLENVYENKDKHHLVACFNLDQEEYKMDIDDLQIHKRHSKNCAFYVDK